MSGGLDSSLVAALLAEAGDDVVGLSMLLWDRSQEVRNGRCCGSLDLGDARRVAEQIGIPHYTLRMDQEFEGRVVAPFVADYVAGRTPSPCVRCNTFIKFDALVARARRLGADRVATGHYARIVTAADGTLELHRGRDRGKDQSYFLFELDQSQLAAAAFPLGEMTKEEVRAEATRRGLLVAGKAESMEVCFVADDIESFVAARLGEGGSGAERGGASRVVDREGRELGTAGPTYRYTVGQRRGLGVAAPRPLYVLEIDPVGNRLIVGERGELARGGLRGRDVHWIGPAPAGEVEVEVRIRSRHPGVAALVRPAAPGTVEVEFATPQEGVAPGQAAVFYDGERVLGGCWIC
ncbi:MAG: tRNA 2-thiouridine(34) synthase MnmA [Thermoanaerobaculia bacterium]|nr:tRNA 2-thiouridine(34) synthase MnmA [Thermoanaerobaculia bacterium]